ncbi:MAG: hypothetical protein NTX50_17905 [Candidatus Sumerlaeota bacterium]|nr:hypothetical protein [Candidatus Sumerlaeota bacterium]
MILVKAQNAGLAFFISICCMSLIFPQRAVQEIGGDQTSTSNSATEKSTPGGEASSGKKKAANAPKESPASNAFASPLGLPDDFVLMCDGNMTTTFGNAGEPGGELTIVRNNVRIFSSSMEIHCDLLIYDRTAGIMKAWPAVGKRVLVTYMGVHGSCGYLEYDVVKNSAVMQRRPVLIQKDPKGNEFETEGYIITLSRDKQGQGSALVQSRKGEIKELSASQPASVEMREPKKAPEVKEAPQEGEPQEITGANLDSIPFKERKPEEKRPTEGKTKQRK